MGFDVHISHTAAWWNSSRAPLARDAVEQVIANSDDLGYAAYDDPNPPTSSEAARGFWWNPLEASVRDVAPTWFELQDGRISTKWPTGEAVARMTAIAVELDAWVVDDQGKNHVIDDSGSVIDREFPPEFRPQIVFRLVSTDNGPVFSTDQEWRSFMQSQSEFAIVTEIRLLLPSGDTFVDCPPTVAWIDPGAESAVPLFFDDGEIEIENVTERMLVRLNSLAAELQVSLEDLSAPRPK